MTYSAPRWMNGNALTEMPLEKMLSDHQQAGNREIPGASHQQERDRQIEPI
jgi:hypothetical protein